MHELEGRIGRWVRGLAIAILLAGACYFVVKTIGWRWQWDTSVFHYFAFLMSHGKAPYRDIVDMNMPGSYFMEIWALAVFGGTDLGWRIYEYLLLGGLTASMIVIALPYDWFAGLFAGVLFTMLHGGDGPMNAVQRDEVMTILIMAGFAFLFTALRSRRAWLMLPFGLLVALAGTLKPTAAPLGLAAMVLALIELRRRKESISAFVLFGVAGFALAGLIVAQFFLSNHDTAAFLDALRRLLPLYASTGNHSFGSLISQGLLNGHGWQALLLVVAVLTLAAPDWKNWERQALALGICFGAFSFLAQRKGFGYHLYLFMAFAFLWCGIELAKALKANGWRLAVATAGVAIGVAYLIPMHAKRIVAARSDTVLADTLQQDLTRLGGAKLQGRVQCMDMVSGCLAALYKLKLVEYSEFPGDMVFFGPRENATTLYYRDILWKEIHNTPPQVFVITNARLVEANSYAKLDEWPELGRYLALMYDLDVERSFGGKAEFPGPFGYKIYVLKKDKQLADGDGAKS